MTGSHSHLGISDRESRTTGVIRAYDIGTRPSKNRKGGSGTLAGVEVYTAPGMKAHFRLAFD